MSTAPDPSRSTQSPIDPLAEDLLAVAFSITGTAPAPPPAARIGPRRRHDPAHMAAQIDGLLSYATDLALVAHRLAAGRRDGTVSCEDHDVLLPVVLAFQDAADFHAVHLMQLRDFLLIQRPQPRAA